MKNTKKVTFVVLLLFGVGSAGFVSAENSKSEILGYSNASTGLPTTGERWGIDFGDGNKDGFLDLAATRGDKCKEGIFIWLGDGTGKWIDISRNLSKDRCVGVTIGDIHHNSYLDICATFYTRGVQVWRQVVISEVSTILIPILGGSEYYWSYLPSTGEL